tara:strand:+ start:793 stop:1659 length:867 start_codon:yes stop_codon:yes gene_type:complete
MARISIGIPVYNEEQCIADTLTSVIRQLDDYPDIDIVISDNASSDKTLQNIETTLLRNEKHRNSIKLIKQSQNKGIVFNFWNTFDNCDSEFFLWVGAHDIISNRYVLHGIKHMTNYPTFSMFCGKHTALSPKGDFNEQTVEYDFSQDNPVERYLRSIATLGNCYIFHSIFRRSALDKFERLKDVPSSDHIIISHLLWSGYLFQSKECFYARRYFPQENRVQKNQAGAYVNARNNVNFYSAYIKDLESLMSAQPEAIKHMVTRQASDLLVKRFGIPFVQQNEANFSIHT